MQKFPWETTCSIYLTRPWVAIYVKIGYCDLMKFISCSIFSFCWMPEPIQMDQQIMGETAKWRHHYRWLLLQVQITCPYLLASHNISWYILLNTISLLHLALGNYELVAMLLRKTADPYISVNTSSFSPGSRGFGNAFAAAAAHGHKNILRKLLAEPGARRENDMLSLVEILSEGLHFFISF